eukprot:TRINITY_DN32862_c0_g1_i1.p1 TRINITY_DN32862_c0_g1~~TRINITY_DN32862_c0_g1_i1.p1  ORF type:complete len:399 (-),score=71.33 TRINITY_DN32862_c0_g1_i1:37-1233(-)
MNEDQLYLYENLFIPRRVESCYPGDEKLLLQFFTEVVEKERSWVPPEIVDMMKKWNDLHNFNYQPQEIYKTLINMSADQKFSILPIYLKQQNACVVIKFNEEDKKFAELQTFQIQFDGVNFVPGDQATVVPQKTAKIPIKRVLDKNFSKLLYYLSNIQFQKLLSNEENKKNKKYQKNDEDDDEMEAISSEYVTDWLIGAITGFQGGADVPPVTHRFQDVKNQQGGENFRRAKLLLAIQQVLHSQFVQYFWENQSLGKFLFEIINFCAKNRLLQQIDGKIDANVIMETIGKFSVELFQFEKMMEFCDLEENSCFYLKGKNVVEKTSSIIKKMRQNADNQWYKLMQNEKQNQKLIKIKEQLNLYSATNHQFLNNKSKLISLLQKNTVIDENNEIQQKVES